MEGMEFVLAALSAAAGVVVGSQLRPSESKQRGGSRMHRIAAALIEVGDALFFADRA